MLINIKMYYHFRRMDGKAVRSSAGAESVWRKAFGVKRFALHAMRYVRIILKKRQSLELALYWDDWPRNSLDFG